MSDTGLAGVGVLVTRPDQQADELVQAVEGHGGQAFRFPTIEIVPRDDDAVSACASVLPNPDIAIFVSCNAVRHGLAYAKAARIAAIGPATAAAIEAAGRSVDIRPASGFDSEHLLREEAFEQIEIDAIGVRAVRFAESFLPAVAIGGVGGNGAGEGIRTLDILLGRKHLQMRNWAEFGPEACGSRRGKQ